MGSVADLVVLRANPLDDIAHVAEIEAVVSHGRLLRRADLDSLSENARRALIALRTLMLGRGSPTRVARGTAVALTWARAASANDAVRNGSQKR